jgi:hypothetical protein
VIGAGSVGAGEAYMQGMWSADDLTALVRIFVRNMKLLDEMEGDRDKVSALEARLENQQADFVSPVRILNEAQAINESIINLAVGTLEYASHDETENHQINVVMVYSDTTRDPLSVTEAGVISDWLKTRLKDENIMTYFIPQFIVGENEDQ